MTLPLKFITCFSTVYAFKSNKSTKRSKEIFLLNSYTFGILGYVPHFAKDCLINSIVSFIFISAFNLNAYVTANSRFLSSIA